MSRVYDDSIKEYEKLVINDDDDITVPTIDKTSTLQGYVKNSVEKDHRDNFLKGTGIFLGTVFRIPALYQQSNYDYNQLMAARQTSARDYKYKVRVPEVDSSFLEIPDTYDGSPRDKAIIDSYTDFTAPPGIKFRVGDKVEVTYENLRTHEGGIILSRIPESLADKVAGSQPISSGVSIGASDSSATPSAGFSESKNILLIGDSHTVGTFGQTLENLFRKNSNKTVDRVGYVGITASKYLDNTPTVGTNGGTGDYESAKRNSYDIVVVLLSTNDAAGITTASGANSMANNIKKLMDMLKGKRKIWVSAPKFNQVAASTYNSSFANFDLNKRVELLWQAGTQIIGAANSIDSRPCTESLKESTGTDIHYNKNAAAQWASCVYKKISSMV